MFLVWLCLWSSINDQYCHTLYYYNICVYTSRKDKQFIIRCLYSTWIGEMYCIIHCTRLMYLSIDILPPVLIKAKVQLDLGFLNRLILHTSTKASIGRKGRRKGIDFLDMVINPPVDVSIGDERNRQNARLMRQVHKATLFVFTHLIILSMAALNSTTLLFPPNNWDFKYTFLI